MAGMNGRDGKAHRLDAEAITRTLERLSARIDERFPNAGLALVCVDLVMTEKTALPEKHALLDGVGHDVAMHGRSRSLVNG